MLGALLGALLGGVAAALMLLAFPGDSSSGSSEASDETVLAVVVVIAYAVVGAFAGAVGAFSLDRRAARPLALWTRVGLVSGLAVLVVLPRVLGAVAPATEGHTSFQRGMLTIAIASACMFFGVVIGKVRGACGRSRPESVGEGRQRQ
jgi:hypothetical protein